MTQNVYIGRMQVFPKEMDVQLEEAEEHIYIMMKGLQNSTQYECCTYKLTGAEKCIQEVKHMQRDG